jgi:SpoIID/LytB domain protein
MNRLNYDSWLGPAVRIGVLQHQKQIRISLRGKYRVTSGGGQPDFGPTLPDDFSCKLASAQPAQLAWRVVLLKTPDKAQADSCASPDPALEPLDTLQLGFEFGEGVSSVEYWRCSRPFGTAAEAEALQARMPGRERISVMHEVVKLPQGTVCVEAGNKVVELPDWIRFEPEEPEESRVVVHDVVVGVGFHWQHFERQRFRGAVEVRVDNRGMLTAVNEIPAEAYLFSVNSSEMMSVMPDELLKAQTVAARNTLFATMGKHHYADAFHLCADDHCQCYRGSSRETADSRRVTIATPGEVLVHEGTICDCRYSKMCGGIVESFESVWNEDPRGYLIAKPDGEAGTDIGSFLPANTEERAAALINAKPDAWCNTTGDDVPPYLRYSAPYFRWEVRHARVDLEARLSKYLGAEIGELKELVPLSRGESGRIEYLKVVGSNGEWTIGTVAKQYSIREAMSPSFLYSSAFVVEYEREPSGKIVTVILRGAGWGHGAGMCQVGATMMAYKGKGYREILGHYYPNSALARLAPEVAKAEAQPVIERQESRLGERCYEFYNCYAVARCPVYLNGVSLESREGSAPGTFVFHQTQDGAKMRLAEEKIECEFLRFQDTEAGPKD